MKPFMKSVTLKSIFKKDCQGTVHKFVNKIRQVNFIYGRATKVLTPCKNIRANSRMKARWSTSLTERRSSSHLVWKRIGVAVSNSATNRIAVNVEQNLSMHWSLHLRMFGQTDAPVSPRAKTEYASVILNFSCQPNN